MHRLKTPSTAGLAVLALVVVLAAGCGGSKKASSTTTTAATTTTATTISTPATDSTVAAQVPAKFKSKTLVVAADATYAPNEFIGSNGKTVEGMDPDLGKALAAVIGV
jgi:polar amino acid transport system substrate-binding protein